MSTKLGGEYQQKKSTEENLMTDSSKEIKVTLLLDREALNKLKTIARKNNVLPKEQINEALWLRINDYEKENGPLKPIKDEDYF